MTAGEVKKLLAASTPLIRFAVLLGLNTGLRQGNVLGMQWKQVDLKERLIKLPGRRTKNRKAHQVDIPLHLLAELKEWKRKTGLTGYLFPNPDHKPENPGSCPHMDRHDIRTDFEKAVAAAELEGVTFHCTRHTFASQFLMNGGDIATLSELLDHSDISITKKIYGHLSREYKRKAIDDFAGAFLSQLL